MKHHPFLIIAIFNIYCYWWRKEGDERITYNKMTLKVTKRP